MRLYHGRTLLSPQSTRPESESNYVRRSGLTGQYLQALAPDTQHILAPNILGIPPANCCAAIAANAPFAESLVIGRIEWTAATWNPVTDCRRCYAERMALRVQAMGAAKYRNGFAATLNPATLEEPLECSRAANARPAPRKRRFTGGGVESGSAALPKARHVDNHLGRVHRRATAAGGYGQRSGPACPAANSS